jgi:hypothetical protein
LGGPRQAKEPRVSHHEKGMAKDADKKATTKKPATKKK